MATTTIPWNDGSGDNITLTYDSTSGDQTVLISSDVNTGTSRSKIITFSSEYATQSLTVKQVGTTISDYVQDGLILHLDGINKGGTSGRWTSLVGSTYYVLNSSVSTSETNAILMKGTAYYVAQSPTNGNYTTGTIEVCAEYLGTGNAAIVYGPSNSLAFVIAASGYSFGIASSNNQWNVTKQDLFTISANSSRFMMNGVIEGTIANNSWGAGTGSTIGGRTYGTNKLYANVRIYSIRKYNRILSEEEMRQNQMVDNARFNLGLTI